MGMKVLKQPNKYGREVREGKNCINYITIKAKVVKYFQLNGKSNVKVVIQSAMANILLDIWDHYSGLSWHQVYIIH